MIVDNTVDVSSLLPRLNSLHASIKFEIELLKDDGFLPALRINNDGEIKHKFFVKEANKGLFLHATSALSSSIKRNAIQYEVRRAPNMYSSSFGFFP